MEDNTHPDALPNALPDALSDAFPDAIPDSNEERDVSSPTTKGNKRGRKLGSKKWNLREINILLDSVANVLPVGREQWEMVASGYLTPDPSWCRTGDQCKCKFEKLAFL